MCRAFWTVNKRFSQAPAGYNSESQKVRVVTEEWVLQEAFCPGCGSFSIEQYEAGRPVADFYCTECDEDYELKSKKISFGNKVVDGDFRAMSSRLASDRNPNLFLLSYDADRRAVVNFLVVPKQFFIQDIIERRKPLSSTAKRAGWTGCNILLSGIPEVGKVYIIRDGIDVPQSAVLENWRQTLFLRNKEMESKRWLIEVMNCVERLHSYDFDLHEIYQYEGSLRKIFPHNRHIREKIRQQLQVLRDRGYLDFVGRGRYRRRVQY